MRLVIQRVLEGSVTVEGTKISQIGKGMVCLVGLTKGDTKELLSFWADKLLKLKLWPKIQKENEEIKSRDSGWSTGVKENNYEVLLVSQFTLYAVLQGNKPDFRKSMEADEARILFNHFVTEVQNKHTKHQVQTGQFQTKMEVGLVNDGPVTINIDEDGLNNKEVQKMINKNKKNQELLQKQSNKQQKKEEEENEEQQQ